MSYYRGTHSPRDSGQYPTYTNPLSPPRNSNRLSGGIPSSQKSEEVRSGMSRRFTTNTVPSLSPLGQQRLLAAGDVPMVGASYNTLLPSERANRHIEELMQQQRRINEELEKLDPEDRHHFEEANRHERALSQMIAQSEPTTPPEYQDSFASVVTRPNRYSMASLASPSGITTRPNRSSTQLTSPSGAYIRPYTATATGLPSQSVPGSRRESDDEDDMFLYGFDTSIHRAAANPNRNSMPVTSYDRNRNSGDPGFAFPPPNTSDLIFDDEGNPSKLLTRSAKASPPDSKTYLHVQHTADGFPKLVSGSSAALDLAQSNEKQQVPERTTLSRHRISLPPTALSSGGNIAPLNSILANSSETMLAASSRPSVEVKFSAEIKRPALMGTPPRGQANGGHPSYSTNDIPTLKTVNGDGHGSVPAGTPSIEQSKLISPEQQPDSLNGNTPISGAGFKSNHSSQVFTPNSNTEDPEPLGFNSTGLHANATPFGPMNPQDMNQSSMFNPQVMGPYMQPAFYSGFNMNMLNQGFSNMSLGGYGVQGMWPTPQMPPYAPPVYGGFQPHQFPNGQINGNAPRPRVGPGEAQARKAQAEEFFASVGIEDLKGQIYRLCKDQHGCRFLQRKLKEGNAGDAQTIFDEVKHHFNELMIDPFGNYLCQRLIEFTNDEQRAVLVQSAAPDMVHIALNTHGTRALQVLIEFISTDEQINMVIEALRNEVVQLIQDINGNHVIQKCLNHLTPHNAQFIFDAVGQNCVAVGTHRHGCCVVQRCVDHATGVQKGVLVAHIVDNAFTLMQDPFGNYVVQYIIDLGHTAFTDPLCYSFVGNMVLLSKQKFSSNVIEKCIRGSSPNCRRMLITEMASTQNLEQLVRDSYGNYVVQTALDHADGETKLLLVENIRPLMASIRTTPHGRRIQSKLAEVEGIETPLASPSGFTPGRGNRTGIVGSPRHWAGLDTRAGNTTFGLLESDIKTSGSQNGRCYPPDFGSHDPPNNGFNGGCFGPTV